MKSLRAYVMVGAILWTFGLMGAWGVALTFHREAFQVLATVHHYPHTLMVSAIAAMFAGFALVGRGLVPLDEMRRRLAAVRAGTANRVDGRFPTEVQPLVTDLNALLAHQERAVSRAHAKAGDLAHGLKTPLAILSHEAERAGANGQTEVAAAISEQVERMRRQIEYHLAHARAAAAGATPGARCQVLESAQGLARTLLRLHADRGLTIDVQVDPSHEARCDRADLDEMLGNLLDNACKWARTRVVVTSRAATALSAGTIPADLSPDARSAKGEGGSYIELRVEDDGPGIEPALREAVLQRGVRADEAAPGSGLGLAIVRELAELYGGGVSLDTAPGGGVSARLILPSV
jgi:signal transduction histidine kinase